MITITKKQAMDLLEKAVAQEGEDTLRACKYADGGDRPGTYVPCCIVGNALAQVGVTVDSLRLLDTVQDHHDKRISNVIDATVRNLSRLVEGKQIFTHLAGVRLTKGAARVLEAAQRKQDRGYTWGEALAEAKAAG